MFACLHTHPQSPQQTLQKAKKNLVTKSSPIESANYVSSCLLGLKECQ